jgi:hypothetical protein
MQENESREERNKIQETMTKQISNFKRQVTKGATGIKASPWPTKYLKPGDALRYVNSDDMSCELSIFEGRGI